MRGGRNTSGGHEMPKARVKFREMQLKDPTEWFDDLNVHIDDEELLEQAAAPSADRTFGGRGTFRCLARSTRCHPR